MQELYVINYYKMLEKIKPVLEEDYARRELISELVMREDEAKSDEEEE